MFTGMNSILTWFLMGMPEVRKGKYNKFQNNKTFMNHLEMLTNFAINTFEWDGLPDTVNEKYLEYSMLFNGCCAIADDPEYGYIGLPFTQNQNVNIYGDSNIITLTGVNGYNKQFKTYIRGLNDEELGINSVRGYDNRLSYPYILYILDSSYRLTQTLRSLDVATKKLKNPFIFIGDKSRENEFKQYFKSLEENDEAILLTDTINMDNIMTIEDTHQDIAVIDALWNQYERLLNDIQQTLGVNNNPNSDKKERLLVDEVNSNNQGTNINLDIRLKAREEFCKDVNDLFGLNISVKLRHQDMIDKYDLNETDKEDNDGNQDNNDNEEEDE